jgi:exopolysaccharide production protein ExoZ
MKRPGLFPWVQGLRALAALSVAFVHVANDAVTTHHDPTGVVGGAARLMPWTAGVDIFFVISGFVIVHASAPLFASSGGPWRFLRRRLTRIVPLYWALTTLFLVAGAVRPSAINGESGGAGYIAASYLFIPWPRLDGMMEPAFGLGWTLNYEMFFYLVLTPFIALHRKLAVGGSAVTLCVLVVIGQSFDFGSAVLTYWADPIILEFILGMGLAQAVAAGWSLPGWARIVMVGIAVTALYQQVDAALSWRMFSYGCPGALLVAAAVLGRQTDVRRLPMRVLTRFGDASYAMYLFHPFVMRGFTLTTAGTNISGVLYVVLSLMVAQLSALAINAWFERKMTSVLRRRIS